MEGPDCGAVGTSTVQQGSDDASNVEHCAQCQESGLSVVASTFCSDCDDFLCNGCVDQHKKLRGLKNHILLEGNILPKVKPRVTGGHKCAEHPGETIKLYCQSDREFGCLLCITESHRNCPDVTSISKLSKDIGMSKELKDLKLSIEKQNAELVSYKQILDEYHILNDKWYDQSVEEFGTFKAKIETVLDTMGKEVFSQARALKESNNSKMKSLTKLLESVEQELESLTHGIEWRETTKEVEQLFIEIKQGTKHIEESVKKLDQIRTDIPAHVQRYKFKVNKTLQKMLNEMTDTVSSPLIVMSGDLECTAEINIKSPDDTAECFINGLAEISTDEMIVADHDNKCLKLINVDSKTIVQRRSLKSPPFDVTFISDDAKVAVSLAECHEIQYFSADKRIEPCGSISVDGECTDVQYSQGTLVVIFADPGMVQIIDLKGSILKSFTTDTAGNQLFDNPYYLSLSPDHADIYVNDDQERLTCVSASNGQLSWKFKNKSVCKVEHEDNNRGDNSDDENEDRPEDEHQSDKVYDNLSNDEDKYLACDKDDEDDEDEDEDNCFDLAGVATGGDGCLYVCSNKSNCIYVMSAAGIRLRVIPVAQYKLSGPECVCYSSSRDALYVSSFSNEPEYCNFIRRLSFTKSK